MPDLLWRREKRPFLLRKRLILARLAAGHVPASLPSPPARRWTQPQGCRATPPRCSSPKARRPPKASPFPNSEVTLRQGHTCRRRRRLRSRTQAGEGPSDGFSIPGQGRSSLSLRPKAEAEPQSEKLGHARSVLTWFFARKGTAEPHFSINTFFFFPPCSLAAAARSLAPVDGGPSPRARD